MKKAIFIVVTSFLLSIAIIIGSQFVLAKTGGKGELQVTSLPAAKVYLDNQFIGQTPVCRCASVNPQSVLDAKEYTLKLVPEKGSDRTPFYEQLTIVKGVLAVVDHTFAGPTLSEGSTLQLEPLDNKTDSGIVITSFPSGVNVLLDSNPVGITPLALSNPTESDHTLTMKKTGYKEKTLHIRTPLGYTLHVIVYLAIDPNAPVQSSLNDNTASTSGSLEGGVEASATATLAPSPVVAKVTILDTPTGFLRVHAEASLGSQEIEEVKPGDSLFYIAEQDGWYQVKLPDNKIGWVSAQYAKKD